MRLTGHMRHRPKKVQEESSGRNSGGVQNTRAVHQCLAQDVGKVSELKAWAMGQSRKLCLRMAYAKLTRKSLFFYYIQNIQRKKQLMPSCLRNKFPPKSLRQLTQPTVWLTRGLDITQLIHTNNILT